MEKNKFAERLRELREEKGLTQNQLAKLMNADINRYERKLQKPTIDMIIKLCEFFNCSAGYLIGLEN